MRETEMEARKIKLAYKSAPDAAKPDDVFSKFQNPEWARRMLSYLLTIDSAPELLDIAKSALKVGAELAIEKRQEARPKLTPV